LFLQTPHSHPRHAHTLDITWPQYNSLNEWLPKYGTDELVKRLLRSAFIGFCSSFVSDCCSNSIRVIKTAKQTYTIPITYREVVSVSDVYEWVPSVL
jgi:hypothetical protein